MRSILIAFCLVLGTTLGLPSKEYEIQKRIAGGDPAKLGEIPFQVGVETRKVTKEGDEYNSWCGGSLISNEWILTASHCLDGGKFATIYLGVTNLSNHDEPGRRIVQINKENLIMHENYLRNYLTNDIALVKLPERVEFNKYIQPVNLPRRSQLSESFAKRISWISGWGNLGDRKGSPKNLQFARRWILPNDYCDYFYGNFFQPKTQFCIDGSNAISACNGDSGGPLTVEEEDGTRTLVGCFSYFTISCESNAPVVYTRLTPYLDWVTEKTGIQLKD